MKKVFILTAVVVFVAVVFCAYGCAECLTCILF